METISYHEIKEKLSRHHNPGELPEDQELCVMRSDADTSGEDVVFFALAGCPPKGYGIFIRERKSLILYTTYCRPFEEIKVDEVVILAEHNSYHQADEEEWNTGDDDEIADLPPG